MFQIISSSNLSQLEPTTLQRWVEFNHFPPMAAILRTGLNLFLADKGVLAFSPGRTSNVIAGEPLTLVGRPGFNRELLDRFILWSHSQKRPVCGYYQSESQPSDHLTSHLAGTSTLIDLTCFDQLGRRFRDVRRAMNPLRTGKLTVREISDQKELWHPKIELAYHTWLASKRGPTIGFILSPPRLAHPLSKHERWFLATEGPHQIEAFVSALPYFNENGTCWYLDHIIQMPRAHRFALDLLISQTLTRFRIEGAREASLGFNPFACLPKERILGCLFWFLRESELIYRGKGLRRYKKKFGGHEIPRYLFIDKKFSKTTQMLDLWRVTYGRPLPSGWRETYRDFAMVPSTGLK